MLVNVRVRVGVLLGVVAAPQPLACVHGSSPVFGSCVVAFIYSHTRFEPWYRVCVLLLT